MFAASSELASVMEFGFYHTIRPALQSALALLVNRLDSSSTFSSQPSTSIVSKDSVDLPTSNGGCQRRATAFRLSVAALAREKNVDEIKEEVEGTDFAETASYVRVRSSILWRLEPAAVKRN